MEFIGIVCWTSILKAALNILSKWECSDDQIVNILGLQESALNQFNNESKELELTEEQKVRISYLLNIHDSLRTVFSNPENVYGFMNMNNKNSFFNGVKPISLIDTGSFDNLESVHKRLDTMKHGNY